MVMVKIKICGITNEEDISYISKKADAVGLIIDVPVKTPRKISLERAIELKNYLSPLTNLVAVIMPESLEEALNVYKELKPDYLQLHGDESLELVKELKRKGIRIIKAIHVEDNINIEYVKSLENYVDLFLFDTKIKDEKIKGKVHNWEITKSIIKEIKKPFIIAGGINKDNVVQALNYLNPYGVDVSSSLEDKPGKKNLNMVDEFIKVVRRWEYG
ncbi:Phosphoribosylanthranilate isomerase [Methanocaldococcus infernus ME]|uniref:N-(5'-phosphoribosyl)anthranilate isomerase n=1 Tax=Methanocaldococcus infernus (strain DSM 11812 / JCM 15783 / ME) TaxID=573063 RepID=D5VSX0_METIM|nr:Phosphoribosylanthranilate isomerase [Methanocaldococcus infernus ME]